jgi:uncharacterized protein YbjT (DUF2867 family)
MKKILVTGATGKVGSRFVARILAKGYDVRILVRDAAKAASLAALGAKIVVGDLYSTDTLPAAVEGIDAVIHLAALFRTFSACKCINGRRCKKIYFCKYRCCVWPRLQASCQGR